MSLKPDIEYALAKMSEKVIRGMDLLSQLSNSIDEIHEQLYEKERTVKPVMWRGDNLDEIKKVFPSWCNTFLFTGEENQFAEIRQKFPETKIAKAKLTLSDGSDSYILIVLSDDAPETLLSETDYPKYVIDTIFPNRWIMEDPDNPKKFIRL